jgi:hypothetical protein
LECAPFGEKSSCLSGGGFRTLKGPKSKSLPTKAGGGCQGRNMFKKQWFFGTLVAPCRKKPRSEKKEGKNGFLEIKYKNKVKESVVKEHGMSEKLGYVMFEGERKPLFLDMNPGFGAKDYSEETAREIDNEVKRITDESYRKVKSMLTERRGLLERVANTCSKRNQLMGKSYGV